MWQKQALYVVLDSSSMHSFMDGGALFAVKVRPVTLCACAP